MNISNKVSGSYVIYHKNDNKKNEIARTKNIITSQGISRMINNSDYLSYVMLGSGSSQPSIDDLELNNITLSSTNGAIVDYGSLHDDGFSVYAKKEFYLTIAEQTFITEIGSGWDGVNCFSRSLISSDYAGVGVLLPVGEIIIEYTLNISIGINTSSLGLYCDYIEDLVDNPVFVFTCGPKAIFSTDEEDDNKSKWSLVADNNLIPMKSNASLYFGSSNSTYEDEVIDPAISGLADDVIPLSKGIIFTDSAISYNLVYDLNVFNYFLVRFGIGYYIAIAPIKYSEQTGSWHYFNPNTKEGLNRNVHITFTISFESE